jgi:ketosteroid isomerase-like protein
MITINQTHFHFNFRGKIMSTAVTQELLQLNQKLLDSIFAGDWKTYANLCADDITCFEPEGLGHLITGLPFHKFYFDLPSGAAAVKPQVTMAAPVVKLLGNDVALILYTRLVQVNTPNGPVTKRTEESRLWQKQASGWKLVHLHRSPPGA